MEELRRKKGFICDMDGVIYHGNRLLPGVKEFVEWLYREQKNFLFLTNSSERSPKELQQKLHRMGLDVPEEKSVLLRHLVLSHHGEPEFGAAVRPVCAESELLSYIDMIDSRMEIYREVLGATPLGGFSDRVFALDGKKLYHHE